ncbi:MAG: nucleotidyltransferase domain-containing protein [candidate division Zixibacteria bacterium]|nr:nucleotidyltransferase domain-containing protein [Candidatus Tariuqbacter arcticus]
MKTKGQNPKLLDEIVRCIAEAVHPERIILFGSRVRDKSRPDSDYDLVVVYDGPYSKRELDLKIRRLFRPPEFSLDLFILSSTEMERFKHVANTLEREVSENGIVLYG